MMKTIKLIQIVNSVGVCRQHLKTSVLTQKDARILKALEKPTLSRETPIHLRLDLL